MAPVAKFGEMTMPINAEDLPSLMLRKKFFLFDFDGVLVDSVEIKTQAFSSLYAEFGTAITDKVVEHHRSHSGMSRYDKFRHYHCEYLGKILSESEMNFLDFSEYVIESIVKAPEILGAESFIKQLSVEKKCVVCSATPEDEIKKIVSLRGWGDYFSFIFGSPATKLENLKKALAANYFTIEESIFFGDAPGDFAAAQECGIDFVGVGSHWLEKKGIDNLAGIIPNFKDLVR